MKLTKTQLKKLVKEAVASSLQKDVMPGSGNLSKLAEDVDKFLMETAERAKEIAAKLEEEIKIDMLGGPGTPSMAPRVGERNRMLEIRAGVLKRVSSNMTALWELLRREG